EKERGITIFSKQAVLSNGEDTITLLDTPGHVDFSAEMERTLWLLDAAILVISAADGIQGHTRTLWKLLKKHNVPVVIFINKMDQPGADKAEMLELLRSQLDDSCVDFSMLDPEVDLSLETEHTIELDETLEQIAVSDEGLLDYFLENGTLLKEQILEAIETRKVFPCLFGSALKNEGVKQLLTFLYKYIRMPSYPQQFGARVYKIARDEQGNRLTYMKVTGGSLRVKEILSADSKDSGVWEEKVNQIRIYSGARFEAVGEALPGSVCAVTGLTRTVAGEGLGIEENGELPVLEPVLVYSIVLPPDVDALSMLPKLRQLEEEDPQLHIVWEEESRELKVQLMGEVQLEVLKCQIYDRFGVKVSFEEGAIVYKETIADTVEGVGHFEPLRHYAEVHLMLSPGEPGTGVQVLANCSEDLLARNWQRLIMTHVEEREHRGVLTGSVLTDVKVTLVAGKAHLKHTEGGDFRQATYRAIRQGLMQAASVLLEPHYEFRLEVPASMVGRAMTDLERLHGNFALQDGGGFSEGNGIEKNAVLTGTIPVSTARGYSMQVTSYTKGTGHFFCTLKGYYPCHNTEEVVEQIGYHPEEDMRNPADSVFCSHGAGVIIPWDQVKEHMHVGSAGEVIYRNDDGAPVYYDGMKPLTGNGNDTSEIIMGVEEIDAIIDKTRYSNKKNDFSHKPGYLKKKPVAKDYGISKSSRTVTYNPKPKAPKYLLVDGYNVIFAWKDLKELAEKNIDGARGALMDILCNYQAICCMEVILVFD
ncbi:MAG: NYN domain-containing protein, partial [Lachnospiraceae bacterium]|nr:NYN domain-containing protein [Lachnospiraceae bacterium]